MKGILFLLLFFVTPLLAEHSSVDYVGSETRVLTVSPSVEKNKASTPADTTALTGDALALRNKYTEPAYQEFIAKKYAGHYDLLSSINEEFKDNPGYTPTQLALNMAVKEQGAKSVLGRLDPRVCAEATPHAEAMASAGGISHANSQNRFNRLFPQLPGSFNGSEIVTPSGTGAGASLLEAARGCVRIWLTSPPHRTGMMNPHSAFCYDMRQNPSGSYFCIGLFVDQRDASGRLLLR